MKEMVQQKKYQQEILFNQIEARFSDIFNDCLGWIVDDIEFPFQIQSATEIAPTF